MIKLGVNIDHVATLRQARGEEFLNPIKAARAATEAGADGITIHLREDRRHIQDDDFRKLCPEFRLNLEMAPTEEMVSIATGTYEGIMPHSVCLVPERREELTTEGGLDALKNSIQLEKVVKQLKAKGIIVSIFIESDPWQIEGASRIGADYIEIHTGRYASLFLSGGKDLENELKRIEYGIKSAKKLGLKVNAGHGITKDNVGQIVKLGGVEELNIGFSIIARAIFVGLETAVREMKDAIKDAEKE